MDIRENISASITVLGLTRYQVAKATGIPQSNLSAFLKGKDTLSVKKIEQVMDYLAGLLKDLKRYKIRFKLSDGNEVNCRMSAPSSDVAIARIQSSLEFQTFKEKTEIVSVSTEIDGGEVDIKPEKFTLKESETPNFWVVSDTTRNVVVKFKKGDFAQQKVTVLFEGLSEIEIATSLKEIGEYVAKYHPELL